MVWKVETVNKSKERTAASPDTVPLCLKGIRLRSKLHVLHLDTAKSNLKSPSPLPLFLHFSPQPSPGSSTNSEPRTTNGHQMQRSGRWWPRNVRFGSAKYSTNLSRLLRVQEAKLQCPGGIVSEGSCSLDWIEVGDRASSTCKARQ